MSQALAAEGGIITSGDTFFSPERELRVNALRIKGAGFSRLDPIATTFSWWFASPTPPSVQPALAGFGLWL